jgi:hypothetical protein
VNTNRQIRSSVVILAACAAVALTGSTATAIPRGDGVQPGPTQTAPNPPAPTTVVVPTVETSTGAHQCFLWHGAWNTADGPQPTCAAPTPPVLARPAPHTGAVECGPVPDVRYVGVPWVAPEPTGCAPIDRWWDFVPA